MDSPYSPPRVETEKLNEVRVKSGFSRGARNGFYWSLFPMMSATFACFRESAGILHGLITINGGESVTRERLVNEGYLHREQ